MPLLAYSTLWWLATGVAVAVELVTGTFYLLMLAIGLAAAALAAHLGAGLSLQLLTAAVVGSGAVLALYRRQGRHPRGPAATANADVNMDVGAIVQVEAWKSDGTADVQYRGANWTAIHRSGNAPSTGAHRIAEVVGSRLLVDKV